MAKPGNVAVVGIQAGDEGKGKIVDMLCEPFDYVVRYQGGHNAGHTVKIGDKRTALHLLPSGILHPGKKCVMGNGMVIDPRAAVKEIKQFDCEGRLFISDRAHLITPWHPAREKKAKSHYGAGNIGTTMRGIGPAYEDKAARRGLRVGAVLNAKKFVEAFYANFGVDSVSDADCEEYLQSASKLASFVCDTRLLLNKAMRNGESILFEGAQGYELDIDHGSYPFVTSSNPTFGGACTGSGVALKNASIIGVAKAYMTRVGGGPFPTKDDSAAGARMRSVGEEIGTSTGRDRDCGWFDAVAVKEAIMVNSVDALVITKLDVLTGFKKVAICTSYKLDGESIGYIPVDAGDYARCEPQYLMLDGWEKDIRGAQYFSDLPANTQTFLHALETICGVPIKIVSVGPERSETMILENVPVMPWMDGLLKTVPA